MKSVSKWVCGVNLVCLVLVNRGQFRFCVTTVMKNRRFQLLDGKQENIYSAERDGKTILSPLRIQLKSKVSLYRKLNIIPKELVLL